MTDLWSSSDDECSLERVQALALHGASPPDFGSSATTVEMIECGLANPAVSFAKIGEAPYPASVPKELNHPQAFRTINIFPGSPEHLQSLANDPSPPDVPDAALPAAASAPPVPSRRPRVIFEKRASWETQHAEPSEVSENRKKVIDRQRLRDSIRRELYESRKEELSLGLSSAFAPPSASTNAHSHLRTPRCPSSIFRACAAILTCCVPDCLLERSLFGGMRDPLQKQLWRQKVAACTAILAISAIVLGCSLYLGLFHCQSVPRISYNDFSLKNSILLNGLLYYGSSNEADREIIGTVANGEYPADLHHCRRPVPESARCGGSKERPCRRLVDLQPHFKGLLAFTWPVVQESTSLVVYNGVVLDLDLYIERDQGFLGNPVNAFLRSHIGLDISRSVQQSPEMTAHIACLDALYRVGFVGDTSFACAFSYMFTGSVMAVTIGIMVVKLLLSLIYHCTASRRLGGLKSSSHLQSPSAKYVLMFVPCFSEDAPCIKRTLDSLAATDYHESRKVLFIVADGVVKAAGSVQTTPETLLDLLRISAEQRKRAQPRTYMSTGIGPKKYNRACVYSGSYKFQNRYVPAILVIKRGVASEVACGSAQPGNRGKRDSMLILMNLLSRVHFDDQMCLLDYEIYCAFRRAAGVTMDVCELAFFVDAGTQIRADSLSRLVLSMESDKKTMGVCGETKVANKRDSWVTRMQVYEYHLSYHYIKAFESALGRVTCLSGCFSLIQIQSRSDDGKNWTPILIHPEVVGSFGDLRPTTLHNLNVLLGEDRYLTTLLLKQFPSRQTLLIPLAVCQTTVPDKFAVLKSQRRRWINSTVHNQLVLLGAFSFCGKFGGFMYFVLCLELFASISQPAFMLTLIIAIADMLIQRSWLAKNLAILMCFGIIFVLPALLSMLASRRLGYIPWMIPYLLSLPIWALVLPLHAFWNCNNVGRGRTQWKATSKHGGKSEAGDRTGSDLDTAQVRMLRLVDHERHSSKADAPSENDESNSDGGEKAISSLSFLEIPIV